MPDIWLSEALSQSCFQLALDATPLSEYDDRALSSFIKGQSSGAFIYSKIPTSHVRNIHCLESLGFRLIATQAIFERSVVRKAYFEKNAVIEFAVSTDQPMVVELARNSFEYSRFRLDPLIDKLKADHIKAEWVRNYFLGKRGEWLVTAKISGALAGFLLLLKDREGILTIDLIAVDQEHQRKGLARGMIHYAEYYCKDVNKIRVGTQITNSPSIKLYEKSGFQLVNSSYVFHYHC